MKSHKDVKGTRASDIRKAGRAVTPQPGEKVAQGDLINVHLSINT